jgi:hypothetical protein
LISIRRVVGLAAAVALAAGLAISGSPAGAADGFSCPDLGGTTLFSGGKLETDGPGRTASFYCTYSKNNVDAGQVAATWIDGPGVTTACPFASRRQESGNGEYNASGRIVSATRPVVVDYRWHDQEPGKLPRSAIVGLAQQLLAAAEGRAATCGQSPATTETTALATTAPATTAPTTTTGQHGCETIGGEVTDRSGKPIEGLRVTLEKNGGVLDEQGTGSDGHYQLTVPEDAEGDLRVVVYAEENSTSVRFRVRYGTSTVGVASPTIKAGDPAADCDFDFAMAALRPNVKTVPAVIDAPAAFDAYQAADDGWTLARRLDAEPSRKLPLEIYVDCETGSNPYYVRCPPAANGAQFDGSGAHPYIALDVKTSDQKPTEIANTIGHEFGHFFQWSAFGGIPRYPGNMNHAGYYANANSADGWTEGFASFYGLMVSRQVSGRPNETVISSWGDQEVDGAAWLNSGTWEEFAVVGILLDLSDAPGESDTTGADQPVDASSIYLSDDGQLFVAVLPAGTSAGTSWRAEALNSAGDRLRTIRGGVVEWKGIPIAVGSFTNVPQLAAVTVTLRPGGTGADDDPIAGNLFDLWRAIFAFKSDKVYAVDGHLCDVEELYRMAKLLYGSTVDRDGNGRPDVDDVFITHGFFGDTKGGVSNQRYDAGEIAGISSHTEFRSADKTYPAMVPRTSPPLLPELKARLDTKGVDATALVQVDLGERRDSGYALLVDPDAEGMVQLPVPPPGSGAQLSVIALADGHQPARALQVDPERFWPEAEMHAGRSFLSASVELKAGEVIPAGGTRKPGSVNSGFPWWLLGLALVAAAALGILGYLRWRPRKSS